MSDERFRRELNQVFDDVAGPTSSNLRDRVHSAVSSAPEARGPYWIAAVAAAVVAALLVGVLLVGGPLRGSVSPVGAPRSSPSPAARPSATSSPDFTCAAHSLVPQMDAAPAVISALSVETHPGYDRFTVEFAANGVPDSVSVSAPGDTEFVGSPSGIPINVKGAHGILVRINGADLHTSYTGSTDIVTGGPTIVEVRRVQDFEGVVQIGLGVNAAGCYRMFWLTGPNRLVIDVQAA